MQELRDYQRRACRRVREEWQAGNRAVCLVAPTGSGKTTIFTALVAPEPSAIVVVHRRELVTQAAERLRGEGLHVGLIVAGHAPDPTAPVQVGTIQTLLARDVRPPAALVVLDECHHYAAADWSTFLDAYGSPETRIVGVTATPQRSDGTPLGDIFSALVEAASYSELIQAGHLVDCHVDRNPADEAVNGWSRDPLTAYLALAPAEQGPCFAFFDRVARAEEWAEKFSAAGIRAAVVSEKTPRADRVWALESFARGDVRVLCNVATLTEGVDVPAASVCILASPCSHPSIYLQKCGRVLRPSPGKTHAVLLDLVSASWVHRIPTADRVYSLTGKAIQAAEKTVALTVCLECGHTHLSAQRQCPRCGFIRTTPPPPTIRIWNVQLRRVYAGAATPEPAKSDEFSRLRAVAQAKGFTIGFAIREYSKLFSAPPPLDSVTDDEWRAEYDALRRLGAARGFKPGFAAARFKSLRGAWPPRAWGNG